MSSKRIQKIKEQILKALEEPKRFKIGDLAKSFYALVIAGVGINVGIEQLKKSNLIDKEIKKNGIHKKRNKVI